MTTPAPHKHTEDCEWLCTESPEHPKYKELHTPEEQLELELTDLLRDVIVVGRHNPDDVNEWHWNLIGGYPSEVIKRVAIWSDSQKRAAQISILEEAKRVMLEDVYKTDDATTVDAWLETVNTIIAQLKDES
jgi:hypothetical protein